MSEVKIRLMGKIKTIKKLAAGMAYDDSVLEISEVYPNRGSSKYGRIYINYEVEDEPDEE